MRDPLVIDARPNGRRDRLRAWLKGRKIMIAGIIALVEVVAFIIWRPSALLLTVAATAVFALAVMGATRVPKGLARDIFWIVALAQGLVVTIPLVVGLSLIAGLLVAVVLIVGLVAVAARWRM